MIRDSVTQKELLQQSLHDTTQVTENTLSESEILNLQDIFLTNGLHQIRVKDRACGRTLITNFLQSLCCFHEVACLTMDSLFDVHAVSMYNLLLEGGYVDIQHELTNLDEFFFEKFYFDFVWIEADATLLQTSWFSEFKFKLDELQITDHIPIVMLDYQ